jgi:hypothetical protein
LGYLFQDLDELKKEAASDTQEYDISELDQTISGRRRLHCCSIVVPITITQKFIDPYKFYTFISGEIQ